jgi:hypothetical protein
MMMSEESMQSWALGAYELYVVRIKGPAAHYLETRTFGCHAIHVLCSVNTLVILLVLPAKKEQICVSFHNYTLLLQKYFMCNFFFLLVERVGFEPGTS